VKTWAFCIGFITLISDHYPPIKFQNMSAVSCRTFSIKIVFDNGDVCYKDLYVEPGQTKGEALRAMFGDGITDEALMLSGIDPA